MKKLLPVIIILVGLGAGGAWLYANRAEKEPTVSLLTMSRGDIIDGVGATGTLQAVTTVTVGTQVSGIVEEMYVDFNDIVTKGKVIARLDPSILQTQVETAKANLVNANANLERQKVAVADAVTKLARAKELSAKQLINKVELENAEVARQAAEAQLKSTQSSIVQAEAVGEQGAGRSQSHRHHRADRRHRDQALGRQGADGRGEHVGAGTVHHRGGPHQDAGQRQHRRERSRPHASRAGS